MSLVTIGPCTSCGRVTRAHHDENPPPRLDCGCHVPAFVVKHAMRDHGIVCDYCDDETEDLKNAGLGVFMGPRCREQIDKAMASGVLGFWHLLDLRRLRSAGASGGAPVAASLCLAPFGNLRPDDKKTPFWRLPVKGFWLQALDVPDDSDPAELLGPKCA